MSKCMENSQIHMILDDPILTLLKKENTNKSNVSIM